MRIVGDLDVADRILQALEAVSDPELPALSIVDLGMVREVSGGPRPGVVLTPTFVGCPATQVIRERVGQRLEEAGLGQTQVALRLAPPWTSDWISDRGRRRLMELGLAPPAPRRDETPSACPRCASPRTEQISAFGGAPCLELRRCLACQEPYQGFKCH